MSNHRSTFSTFRNRTFRNLWIASVVSNFGGLIQLVGAAWLMTTLTSSPTMVSLVQTSNTLPIMLTSLIAGVLADNFDRRRVMMTAQLFMLAVSIVLTAAVAGLLTPWLLLLFTFLIGCGTALHYPSWLTSIGDIVEREDLPNAVSLNAMGTNLTRSLGPASGGAIVAVAGVGAAFAVNAVSYLAILFALFRWRPTVQVASQSPERFISSLTGGLHYLMMSPVVMQTAARGVLLGFAAIAVQSLLPIVVREQLQGDAFLYGVLLGCFSAGAVTMAFLNDWVRSRLGNEAIIRTGFLVLAISACLLAVSQLPLLAALAVFAGGMCWLGSFSLLNVVIQLSVARWVVGRMIAVYMTAIFGGMAAGAWVWGLLAERFGLENALFCASGLLVIGALVGYWLPLVKFSGRADEPAPSIPPPGSAIPLSPQSGAVKITIDYEINSENQPEFLRLMARRRQIRLRNGARRWSLSHDVEAPHLWFETYHFANWADYMRYRDRRTGDDALISDALAALHGGTLPLHVRRVVEAPTAAKQG